MMTYKTSGLVKRALQLADLEGSNFISWNEITSLLNESYVSLFQKLIDKGDKSFMKEFHTSSGTTPLPRNFWQLKGLYAFNNGNLEAIPRRAESGSMNRISYEIKNNVLVVYGSCPDVLFQYFETPKTLMTRPNDYAIPLEARDYLDCYKHTYVYYDDVNECLSLFDLDGYKTKSEVVSIAKDDIKKVYLCENNLIVSTVADTVIVYNILSGYSCFVSESGNVAPVITESGNFFLCVDDKIYTVSVADETYTLTELSSVEFTGAEVYFSDDDFTDVYYLLDGDLWHNDVNLDITCEKAVYSDGDLYTLGKLGFVRVTNRNEILMIDNACGLYVGFNGINQNTGYGYTSKLYGVTYYVRPFAEDVVLNFPNNFYYQMLSYTLAIAFRIKQGADVSGLAGQLSTVEQTFFDTMDNDAFMPTRITNVY